MLEIWENVNQFHFSTSSVVVVAVLEYVDIFQQKRRFYVNMQRVCGSIFEWINTHLNFFLALISNMVNIDGASQNESLWESSVVCEVNVLLWDNFKFVEKLRR